MKGVELFCGTKSFSKEYSGETFTVDNDAQHNPDLVKNIQDLQLSDFPEEFRNPDHLWLSPPCTTFSVASIGRHWKNGNPSKEAIEGIEILSHCVRIIMLLRPNKWYMENPRGMMRKLPFLDCVRNTVTYCQYGDERMKPTDIWTNDLFWKPRPACKNGMSCHVSAPRGSRTGTQGIKGAVNRGVVPKPLIQEILSVYGLSEVNQ